MCIQPEKIKPQYLYTDFIAPTEIHRAHRLTYEIVILTGSELQTIRVGCEDSKKYRNLLLFYIFAA